MIVEVHWHAWTSVRGCERTKKLDYRQISAFHPATTGQGSQNQRGVAQQVARPAHPESQQQPAWPVVHLSSQQYAELTAALARTSC